MRATGPSTPDATAPMPTETGRSIRHMRRRLPKLIRSCRLTATLGLSAQPELWTGAQAWAARIFGTHDGGAGPIRAALPFAERYYGGT